MSIWNIIIYVILILVASFVVAILYDFYLVHIKKEEGVWIVRKFYGLFSSSEGEKETIE